MATGLFAIVSSVMFCVIENLLIVKYSFNVGDGRTVSCFQYQSLGCL